VNRALPATCARLALRTAKTFNDLFALFKFDS